MIDEYLALTAERRRTLLTELRAFESTPEANRAEPLPEGLFRRRQRRKVVAGRTRLLHAVAAADRVRDTMGRFEPEGRLLLEICPLAGGGWEVTSPQQQHRHLRVKIRDPRELGWVAAPLMQGLLHRLGWPVAS